MMKKVGFGVVLAVLLVASPAAIFGQAAAPALADKTVTVLVRTFTTGTPARGQ